MSTIQKQMQEAIQANAMGLDNLTGRVDRVVEGFTAKIQAVENTLVQLSTGLDDVAQKLARLQALMGIEGDVDPFYPEFLELTAKVEELTSMIEGRNKSAPTKRNMTDADAIRVMTGDLKDMSHKDAAEAAHLTYAQVYSCRLEYTFKHVHKQLRDENKEFKNPWAK